MHFVIDEIPNFCPKCGTQFNKPDKYAIQDFEAGASHSCNNCYAQWQKSPYDEIKKLASKNGDAGQYWR